MRIVFALMVVALVAACASGAPPLPDARDAVVRVVRVPGPDNPAQYMIRGSQVFVTGTNFDRGALAGRDDALAIRIDELVADRLRERRVVQVATDSPAEVALIPKARLVRTGDSAQLVCTLEAQYSVGGMAHDFVHRIYSYTAPQARKLVGTGEGWTDHEGAAFQMAVRTAFANLTDAFIADWQGRLASGKRYDMGDFVATVSDGGSVQTVVVTERATVTR